VIVNQFSNSLTSLREKIARVNQSMNKHPLKGLILLFVACLLLILIGVLSGPIWRQNFLVGMLKGFLGIMLALPASAILWCLVIILSRTFLRFFVVIPFGQVVRETLVAKQKTIVFLSLLFLFAILEPVVIWSINTQPLSAGEFAVKYLQELVSSVIMAALIVYVWRVLAGEGSPEDKSLVAESQDKISQGDVVTELPSPLSLKPQISESVAEPALIDFQPIADAKVVERQERVSQDTTAEIHSFKDAYAAWAREEISKDVLDEFYILYALEKYMVRDAVVGWHDLKQKMSPNGYMMLESQIARHILAQDLQKTPYAFSYARGVA